MTNLFAALGWTLAQLVLHPDVLARVVAGDAALLERCALESTRIGQCSVMLRTVMHEVEIDDGARATGSRRASRSRRCSRSRTRRRRPASTATTPTVGTAGASATKPTLPAREAVTTFGFGPHRCPAQRFSLSAITRTVGRLADALRPRPPSSTPSRPMPEQIGGVGRAADPCPIAYSSSGRSRRLRAMRFVEVNGVRMSAIGLGTWQFGSKDWGYGSDYADVEAGRILAARARSRREPDRHRRDLRARRTPSASSAGRSATAARRRSSRQGAPDRADRQLRREATAARAPSDSASTSSTSTRSTGPTRSCRSRSRWKACAGCRRRASSPTSASATSRSRAGAPPKTRSDRRCSSNQVQYSLVARKPDAELVPYAQANDRLVIAYSPLGMKYD